MNFKSLSFIGATLLLTILFVGVKNTNADFCSPGHASSYKSTYCKTLNSKKDTDAVVVKTVSTQFGLDEDLVNQILSGTICQRVKSMTPEERQTLPEKVVVSCLPKQAGSDTVSISDQLLAQNLFLDVQNSYQKEKAMHFNKLSLEAKFKASEQYWDGKIGALDAPFDVMVDLNLIDIVLFGSKSKWNGDVFSFPTQEDEAEAENDEIPLDGLNQEQNNGVSEQEQGENPINCVPFNDSNADPNVKTEPPLCGKGSVDALLGEVCDDGNKTSGDGCNQYCQSEINGTNLMCQDPEALTFKQAQKVTENGNLENQDPVESCPPGYVPKKDSGSAEGITQFEEYPGPFVGGTLKQFSESARPICGPGTSPVEITVAGQKQIATYDNGDPRCLPTEFCSDPDTIRTFLAASSFPFPVESITATQWKQLPEDNPIRQFIESIEVVSCVNIHKENRPLTYYNPNEGCIDCHIRAMVDALENALTTNVTPLANPTQAFGLSSRFGPNFSFNLITTLKPKLKLTPSNTSTKAVESADQAVTQMQAKANLPTTTLPQSGNDAEILEAMVSAEQTALQESYEELKNYKLSNGAISDIELSSRVGNLLVQMRASFESLQSKYQGMVLSTALNEKNQCQ